MKFLVTVAKDESGLFVVECPALPGCLSQGKTRAEALSKHPRSHSCQSRNPKVLRPSQLP